MESIFNLMMVNPVVLFGIGIINFIAIVSFIIILCSRYKNKLFVLYMHMLFWTVFNITIVIVGILPQINKIIEELNKINVIY